VPVRGESGDVREDVRPDTRKRSEELGGVSGFTSISVLDCVRKLL
jgi:hypothetical protein